MVFTLLRRVYSIFVTSESCVQSLLHTCVVNSAASILLEDTLARRKKHRLTNLLLLFFPRSFLLLFSIV